MVVCKSLKFDRLTILVPKIYYSHQISDLFGSNLIGQFEATIVRTYLNYDSTLAINSFPYWNDLTLQDYECDNMMLVNSLEGPDSFQEAVAKSADCGIVSITKPFLGLVIADNPLFWVDEVRWDLFCSELGVECFSSQEEYELSEGFKRLIKFYSSKINERC